MKMECVENIKQEKHVLRFKPQNSKPLDINREVIELMKQDDILDEDIIKYYEGFGVEKKSKNGLVGLHEARKENLGQFFTDLRCSKLIMDILKIPHNATVFDNSCGTGRLAWYLPNKKLFTGIEYEETAYNIAKKLYPQSCIIQDDLINHVPKSDFDYALFNPPFSLNLKCKFGNLNHISYGGGILSQVASIEIGVRAVKVGGYFMLIAPSNLWELESTRNLHKWVKEKTEEVLRLDLPKDTFVGTDWNTTLYLFRKVGSTDNKNYYWGTRRIEEDVFKYSLDNYTQVDYFLQQFFKTEHYQKIKEYSETRDSVEPILLTPYKDEVSEIIIGKAKLCEDDKEPKVTISVVKNKLVLRPNNLLCGIKLANVKANFERRYDYSRKDYIETLKENLKLDDVWSNKKNINELEIFRILNKYNLKYEIKDQALNWIEKKKRFYIREVAPFEQQVKKNESSDWENINVEDGVRNVCTDLYYAQEKKLEKLYSKVPHLADLYNYQKDDVLRLSLKKSSIVALEQGLGKTKVGISLSILKGCKRNLFIVPSHLINTWEVEFQNFGLDYKVIKNENDVKDLKQFNLISYNTLKKKIRDVNDGYSCYIASNGRRIKRVVTMAHLLKKRFKFVLTDEAHYCSNKTTSQTQAVMILRARYKVQMTGTPIGNTVKNIYSLLDIGWGVTNPFFNYTPKQFREEFVSVEWVTPEFDETLSSGRTAQQVADIKNKDVFIDLMSHKWLRRVKAEPEVQESIKIPKPEIVEFAVKPERVQLEHYKKHLEDFATIFRKYLHPETEEDHKINQSIVLAKLQNLQFCSTIPQHEKVNPDVEFSYIGDKTNLQLKTLELIEKHYKDGKKIVVFTQRPDFCKFLKSWLKDLGINSAEFTGKINIKKRNEILDDFRKGELQVLLASIFVTDTGLNIPEANVGIITDPTWKYSTIEQAYSRILRPQTKGKPKIYLMRNLGTVDEYLHQHCQNKKGAIDEVLEKKDDIEKIEWTHWTDFIIRMLKSEGLM